MASEQAENGGSANLVARLEWARDRLTAAARQLQDVENQPTKVSLADAASGSGFITGTATLASGSVGFVVPARERGLRDVVAEIEAEAQRILLTVERIAGEVGRL